MKSPKVTADFSGGCSNRDDDRRLLRKAELHHPFIHGLGSVIRNKPKIAVNPREMIVDGSIDLVGIGKFRLYTSKLLWEWRLRPQDHTNDRDRSQASFLPLR